MQDGLGQARLDLGLSFGFLGAGPNRGSWMWAEGCDHLSREALHLARVLLSKIVVMGSCFSLPHGGCWGMARALLQRKLAAVWARLRRKFLAASARWREECCQSGSWGIPAQMDTVEGPAQAPESPGVAD